MREMKAIKGIVEIILVIVCVLGLMLMCSEADSLSMQIEIMVAGFAISFLSGVAVWLLEQIK